MRSDAIVRRCVFTALLGAPVAAFAQTPASQDSGDTAWMLTATMLVLLTIPELPLFYGGMARAKNLLSVLMQCFAITALISVLWMLYGYSVAFSTRGMRAGVTNLHSFVGGLDRAMFAGMAPASLYSHVPENVFAMFQLTFAIITPALIVGAVAERMKFSVLLVFTAAWFTVVYLPMAHMVWVAPVLSWVTWACSILPAARWCTSTPASPGWSLAWCWDEGAVIPTYRCRHTTSATR